MTKIDIANKYDNLTIDEHQGRDYIFTNDMSNPTLLSKRIPSKVTKKEHQSVSITSTNHL